MYQFVLIQVYCLDTRNHGDSEWSDVLSFDVNVVDLLHFMDSHQIPKAVLIGHSTGGVTCMLSAFKEVSKRYTIELQLSESFGIGPQ